MTTKNPQHVPTPPTISVRRMSELRSRQWAVYVNGELAEGGFFSRAAAEECAAAMALTRAGA